MATVESVAAGAIGVALLGEKLSAPKLLGALLVLSGAVLAQVRLEKMLYRESTVSKAPSQPR